MQQPESEKRVRTRIRLTLQDLSPSDVENFWARVIKDSDNNPSGCWFWKGRDGQPSRHRQITVCVSNKRGAVPRIAYELTKGEIKGHLDLAHTCGFERCINPDHLKPESRTFRFAVPPGPRAPRPVRHAEMPQNIRKIDLIPLRKKCSECLGSYTALAGDSTPHNCPGKSPVTSIYISKENAA